ncbi:NADH-quinone oxidoreductase subunit H [Tepidibacillus marianensis]|uniref:respiratory chain complex I subunit 1 family protein n=1 Tax=Tepidibacillus marianensis TaxID=3131995 RepID=UPI0030CF3232
MSTTDLLFIILQVFLILLFSPLLQGIIKKTKAFLQSRKGPSIWQGYYDLVKYFRKSIVLSEDSSWITKSAPYLVFSAILVSSSLVVTFFLSDFRGNGTDILILIYLFAFARFFTSLVGFDAASSFGGMGSSREATVSIFAEPALFIAIFSYSYQTGFLSFDSVIQQLNITGFQWFNPTLFFSFIAMMILLITETGRIPIDNPDTHLELTMIHEGMLLEFTGRHLAMMTWAHWMKEMVLMSMVASFFLPFEVDFMSWSGVFINFVLYLVKVVGIGIVLAFVEMAFAKIRFFKIPKLLGVSMIFSILAFVSNML